MSYHQVYQSLTTALELEDQQKYLESFIQYTCCIDLITSNLRDLTVINSTSTTFNSLNNSDSLNNNCNQNNNLNNNNLNQNNNLKILNFENLSYQQLFYFARECIYRSESILKNNKHLFPALNNNNQNNNQNNNNNSNFGNDVNKIPNFKKNLLNNNDIYGNHLIDDFNDDLFPNLNNKNLNNTLQNNLQNSLQNTLQNNKNNEVTFLEKASAPPLPINNQLNSLQQNSLQNNSLQNNLQNNSLQQKRNENNTSINSNNNNNNTLQKSTSMRLPPKVPSKNNSSSSINSNNNNIPTTTSINNNNNSINSSINSNSNNNIVNNYQQQQEQQQENNNNSLMRRTSFVKDKIEKFTNNNLQNNTTTNYEYVKLPFTYIPEINNNQQQISSPKNNNTFNNNTINNIVNNNTINDNNKPRFSINLSSSSSSPNNNHNNQHNRVSSSSSILPLSARSSLTSSSINGNNNTSNMTINSNTTNSINNKNENRKSLSARMIQVLQERDLVTKILTIEENKYFSQLFEQIDFTTKDNLLDIREFIQFLSFFSFDQEFLLNNYSPYYNNNNQSINNLNNGNLNNLNNGVIRREKLDKSFGGRIFNAFDINKSGMIEMWPDFKFTLSILLNNNNSIDGNQLNNQLNNNHLILEEQAKFGFKLIDLENKGYFTKNDLISIFKQILNILEYMGLEKYNQNHLNITTTNITTNNDDYLLIDSINNTTINSNNSNSKFGNNNNTNLANVIGEMLFYQIDLNRDGKVTFDEYFTICKNNPFILQSLGILSFDNFTTNVTNNFILKRINLTLPKMDHNNFSVAFGHVSFHKVISMMIGIRIAQENISYIQRFYLYSKDFRYMNRFELPNIFYLRNVTNNSYGNAINGSSEGSSTIYGNETFIFTDYAPLVFRQIRKVFGILEEEWTMSFSPEMLFGNLLLGKLCTLSEKLTDGKSGNFFFSTFNNRFLCKTISQGEFQFFLKILENYFKHILNYKDTLLCRIYGLYKLNDIGFIVMENVFETTCQMDRIFDLKGSTIGRTNPSGVGILKDLDFIGMKRFIQLESGKKEKLMRQLSMDVKFLEENEIIDYSLLVGVYDCNNKKQQSLEEIKFENKYLPFFREYFGGMRSKNGDEIYFIGVIDILIEYGLRKRGENLIKTIYFGDENGISVVEPTQYARRFLNFINSIVIE
ncbi:hypothetical protein ABK040_016638 [Willaertia magna]